MEKIKVNHLEKKFGSHVLFQDLSFQIEQGEMVAIVGSSGCGKTTLLNILGLIEPFENGEVWINGKRVPKPNTRAAQRMMRDELSYLFQNFALIDTETVEKNLKLVAKNSQLISEVLKTVGLERTLHQKVYELSGGEQQRVAIARILLKKGNIVLADEPTGSLDHENRDFVLRLLRDLCEQGKTVLIVTHDPVVAQACDRILYLS